MKKILITLSAVIAMGLCATAQVVPDEVDIETDENVQLEIITPAEPVQETEQEIKEREKRLRELNDDIAFGKASNSMNRGYFVLVADNIQIGRSGYRHFDISRNTNFILVQGEDGIIQYALMNTGSPGSNGLGGCTAKGQVRNKRITCGNNGDVHMQYDLVGPRVNTTIFITLYHNSKRAIAELSDGGVIFYGEILPYRDNAHR
jgi:hypothetical protein